MNRIRRIVPIASVIAAVAVLALAGGMSRAKAHPPDDPSLLIARGGQHAAPPASGEADECTRSAGFWAPADDAPAGDGTEPRRMECKRYA
ncbi:MAG TPA: hypothetical protein VGG39_35155 [Polyangiaceae bacterium]